VNIVKAGGGDLPSLPSKDGKKELRPVTSKPSAAIHATTDSSFFPSLYKLFQKAKEFFSKIPSFPSLFKASTSSPKGGAEVATMVKDSQTFPAKPSSTDEVTVKSTRAEIAAAKAEIARIKAQVKQMLPEIKKGRQGVKEKGISVETLEYRERRLGIKERELQELFSKIDNLNKTIKSREQHSIPFLKKLEKQQKSV